MMYFEVLKRFE
jgi:ATP-dependent RNA helicase DOB1